MLLTTSRMFSPTSDHARARRRGLLRKLGDFYQRLFVAVSGDHDGVDPYDSYGFSPDAFIGLSTPDSDDRSALRHEVEMTG